MRNAKLLTVAVLLLSTCFSKAQSRVFLSGSPGQTVPLPTAPGQEVVLASVSLGTVDRPSTISKITATGTMTADPAVEAVSYELLFLVCDQPDCLGAVKSPVVLWLEDWQTPIRIIATKSFGIVERHITAELLGEQGLHRVGNVYVAMAIKLLHGSAIVPGNAMANLFRVEVVP